VNCYGNGNFKSNSIFLIKIWSELTTLQENVDARLSAMEEKYETFHREMASLKKKQFKL
jgi:hypothetical protein